MADVVRFAGGWLFDRVMAGWDVMVLTADPGDWRPLQILGVHPLDLEWALSLPLRGPQPQCVAVDAELYASDERIRDRILEVLDQGRAEVRFWEGDRLDADPGPGTVQHRLSVAACAFKAQAMAAADTPPVSYHLTELFRSGELLRPSRSA